MSPHDPPLVRSVPVDEHSPDVGRDDQQVRDDVTRKDRARKILVDNRLDPGQDVRMPLRKAVTSYVGTPPPPAQMTTAPFSSSHWIGRSSRICKG